MGFITRNYRGKSQVGIEGNEKVNLAAHEASQQGGGDNGYTNAINTIWKSNKMSSKNMSIHSKKLKINKI